MYGENTNTIAIPIYRVLPYPVIRESECKRERERESIRKSLRSFKDILIPESLLASRR